MTKWKLGQREIVLVTMVPEEARKIVSVTSVAEGVSWVKSTKTETDGKQLFYLLLVLPLVVKTKPRLKRAALLLPSFHAQYLSWRL